MKQNITHTHTGKNGWKKKTDVLIFFLSLANYDSNASNKQTKKNSENKKLKNWWKTNGNEIHNEWKIMRKKNV